MRVCSWSSRSCLTQREEADAGRLQGGPLEARLDGRHHGGEHDQRPAHRQDYLDADEQPRGSRDRDDARIVLGQRPEEREGDPLFDAGLAGAGERAGAEARQPIDPPLTSTGNSGCIPCARW